MTELLVFRVTIRSVFCALIACVFALLSTSRASAQPTTRPALFPANGAVDVCPDVPLRITFSAPPTIGQGKMRIRDCSTNEYLPTVDLGAKTATQSIGGLPNFNYHVVQISGNDATICLPNGSLKYNTKYAVEIEPGSFKFEGDAEQANREFAAWEFTTRAAPPVAGTTKLTVAADGSGDFCTLQGAIDFIPDGNKKRTTLQLRNGTYSELVFFTNKHAVTITGEDRAKTVIEYPNNAKFNPASDRGTYHRGVFLAANCNELVINNLTIRNTTPRGGSQAEALILNGTTKSRAIVANVDLYSFQDTLQINGQAYLRNCYIEGDVDFMWGSGPCFFENCHAFGTRSKAYYTQIRNPPTNHGYVYYRCTLDGPPGVEGMYLSRIEPERFSHSEVVLIDCTLGAAVSPVAWLLNAPKGSTTVPTVAPDVHFWEFNSRDASGQPVDVTRRLGISRQLKTPDDEREIKYYSEPTYVLGEGWNPRADLNLPADSGKLR